MGLQVTQFEGLEEQIFERFEHMYKVFEASRARIDPANFHEVRYEDLVADPVGQMRAIYENLDLGDFEEVLPALEQRAVAMADYKTNRFELDPSLREKISSNFIHQVELGYILDFYICLVY